jgi:hypothetical protein
MAGEKVGFTGWWVYYTAPFVGAGVAALMTSMVFGLDEEDEEEEEVTEKATVPEEPVAAADDA